MSTQDSFVILPYSCQRDERGWFIILIDDHATVEAAADALRKIADRIEKSWRSGETRRV